MCGMATYVGPWIMGQRGSAIEDILIACSENARIGSLEPRDPANSLSLQLSCFLPDVDTRLTLYPGY